MEISRNYYIFGSRVLTHVLFWLGYYLLFGFIWAEDQGFYQSYYLEFILFPIRITGAYIMIYVILPRTLLVKQYFWFLMSYGLLLIGCAVVQRHFIYFFYEHHEIIRWSHILAPEEILRAVVLINSTILLLAGFKILQLYYIEREKNLQSEKRFLEIKSDKRTHRVNPNDVAYVKGMGNYVTYFLIQGEKIISYSSMKEALEQLPGYFKRIHKSYIVNENQVSSYNKENVVVNDQTLPIGKSMTF